MKKIILILTLSLATVCAHAQFLFRISGNHLKEASYILGSVHTLPGSLLDSIPEYLDAEANCKQLYAEYDVSSQQAMSNLVTAGQQAVSLPDGKTIFDVLNMEQMDKLDYRFKEVFHINITDSAMKAVWNYQPVVLISTFSLVFTTQEMQKHPELGLTGTPIDLVCINRAKERGMTLGQLDEIQPEDRLKKMRDSLNSKIDVQVDSLMAFLNDFDHRKQMIVNEVEMVTMSAKYWKEADYDHFATSSFMIAEVDKQPAFFKQRNEKWLPKMQIAMNEAPTIFVFGAGHLIGDYGILQLLRNAGYNVEQIKKP